MPKKDEVEYDKVVAGEETKAYSDFNMAKSASRVVLPLLLEFLELLEDLREAFRLPEVELLPFLPVPFLPLDPLLPLDGRLVGLKVASRPVLLPRAVGRLEATRRDGAGDDTKLSLATGEGVGDDTMGGGVDRAIGDGVGDVKTIGDGVGPGTTVVARNDSSKNGALIGSAVEAGTTGAKEMGAGVLGATTGAPEGALVGDDVFVIVFVLSVWTIEGIAAAARRSNAFDDDSMILIINVYVCFCVCSSWLLICVLCV